MNAVVKDLKYFLANPDEMPEDPKVLEQLANDHMAAAMESGTEQMDIDKVVGTDTPEKVAATEAPKAEAATVEVEPPVTPPEPEGKPDGIQAKDGKNIIPYSALETERQRRAAAEQLSRDLANQLAAATESKAPSTPTELLTAEELDTLEQDSPTLAKTLRALQQQNQVLADEIKQVRQVQQSQEVREDVAQKNDVREAIDSNPTLVGWEHAEDKTAWLEACRLDKLMRASEDFLDYQALSYEDRFKEVVKLVEAKLDLHEEPEPPVLTPVQIKAAAAEKLKTAKAQVPRSLSDIPGGAPPAVDERDKVEQMSSVELGSMFMKMTREQQDAYLSTL